MSLPLSFTTFLVELLLPPASLAYLALFALLFLRRRLGRIVAAVLLAPLVLMSLPPVAALALLSLEPSPAESGPEPGAIVILSGDVERTGEVGHTEVGALTLERERAGAELYRRTGLPILVTGGVVTAPPPVGILMSHSLPDDFRVPVKWVESKSRTTWENAQLSAPMLREAGISRVYLVTHAWHMRRSLLAFRRAGLDPVPVAVRTEPWPRWRIYDLFPRASAWLRCYYAVHEWVGLAAYSLRG